MIKKFIALSMMLLIIILSVGCSKDENIVTVATKPHTEQYILGELITQLIENHTDIEVDLITGIAGGTANIHPAMINGEIDIYPEYTGTGWLTVLKQDLIKDPMELYKKVKKQYKEEFNIVWLDLYGFNNTYAISMKEEVAEEMGIDTYTDLAKKGNELVFGANYDFYEREDGYNGLVKTYNLNFKSEEEVDIGLKYEALKAGEVDVINAFSTDALLKKYNLRVLKDDKAYFPSYYAATLIRQETLDKHPELEEILNMLSNEISEKEMVDMNYEVENDNKDPKDVAKSFLERKGLLQ